MKGFIVAVTAMGKIIKIPSQDIPFQMRGGQGVKIITMSMESGDRVVSSFFAPEVEEETK